MNAQRARRVFAVSAAGVLMAGGAAVGAAGTASAATSAHPATIHTDRCHDRGWWGNCDDGFGHRHGDFFHDGIDTGGVIVIVLR